jgi:hypothetical protein
MTPVCGKEPLARCRTPTAATKAILTVRGGPASAKSQMEWEWVFDRGDATASDPVLLCVYDAGRLLATAPIPARRTCGKRACRRERTTSFEYGGRRGAPRGAGTAQLQTIVSPAETRLQLRAKGSRLAASRIGDVAAPVTVQLLTTTGTCVGSVYSAPRSPDTTPRDTAD